MADFAGRDTHDSCVRARQVFGAEHVIVVSQGFHVPRAVALCRAAGLQVDGVGEETMRTRYAATWSRGALREWPAAYKAALDALTRREPVGGDERAALQRALG